MLHSLNLINRGIEKALEWALLLLLGFFLCLIAYQVVSRNFPLLPPIYWTEEFSRFSFQWTIMLGTALGVLHSDHFVLDAFAKDSRMDRTTRRLREFVILVIAIFFIWSGWDFAQTGWRRHSTAANLPMFWIYVCFFASGVLMALFSAQRILMLLTKGLDAMERDLNTVPPEDLATQPEETDLVPLNSSRDTQER